MTHSKTHGPHNSWSASGWVVLVVNQCGLEGHFGLIWDPWRSILFIIIIVVIIIIIIIIIIITIIIIIIIIIIIVVVVISSIIIIGKVIVVVVVVVAVVVVVVVIIIIIWEGEPMKVKYIQQLSEWYTFINSLIYSNQYSASPANTKRCSEYLEASLL